MQKTHSFTRTLIFIFSLIVAYFLWTYLRSRFVTPEEVTPITQITQETESTEKAPLSEKAPANVPREQTPENSTDQSKKEFLSAQKTLTSSQKTSPDEKTTPAQPITKNEVTLKTAAKKTNALSTHTITVTNGIEKKMLGYRKFGTHYPTRFKLTVGDKTLEEGSSINTPIQGNTFIVRYDFEFMNGYRNGAEEVTFTLKPNVENLTLVFDWKSKNRLYAEGDKIISIVEKNVPYQS